MLPRTESLIRWGLILALVATGALAGMQTVRLAGERAAHAKTEVKLADEKTAHEKTKTAWADDRTSWERESRVAVEAALAETNRRIAAAQKEVTDARTKAKNLEGQLADARDAGQRLLDAYTAAAGRNTTGDGPATASGSPAADATADLLADVRRRMVEAENGTIKFADEAHLAGLTCERIHGTLNAPSTPSTAPPD